MSASSDAASDAADRTPKLLMLPKPLHDLITGRDRVLVSLRESYPWLRELDSNDANAASTLQTHFLADSLTFMQKLDQFLHIKKWEIFMIYECTYNSSIGPTLLALLTYVLGGNAQEVSAAALHTKSQADVDAHLTKLEGMFADVNANGFLEMFRSSYDEASSQDTMHVMYDWYSVCDCIAERLQLNDEDADLRLEELTSSIEELSISNPDSMLFGYAISYPSWQVRAYHERLGQPPSLEFSTQWRRIGELLCSLGRLVGADVPRWRAEAKPTSIVNALHKAANSQGEAARLMLAKILEQDMVIRKQQKAITALQFRHLLEMTPGAGVASPAGQTTSQWKQFWMDAVTKAYTEYITLQSAPQGGQPAGQHAPSPLAKLFEKEFARAYKKQQTQIQQLQSRQLHLQQQGRVQQQGQTQQKIQAQQIQWLIQETTISQQGQALYGTLSQVIHDYSSDEFSIDPLSYSPGDVDLLKALTPDRGTATRQATSRIEDGEVDWVIEKSRYIW